jgi:hypothetical protein
MSSKEFPNNWQDIHDADPAEFGECSYEDFMIMSAMWSIPSSHSCILRVHNTDTNKIKEYAYRRTSSATKRLVELVDDPANVITICDDESIHYLVHPENVDYQL